MALFDDSASHSFRLSGKKFLPPRETLHLDPKLKREVTICNLFAEHNLAVADIIRILDESFENVIRSLIKHQLLIDRRQRQEPSPVGYERRRLQSPMGGEKRFFQ